MTPMTWDEWTAMVAKIGLRWPDQPISDPTADEWWTELRTLAAGDVWLAIRAHLHGPRGMFRPQLADILAGVAAHHAEMREQLRAQEHAALQLERTRPGRKPPPPEYLRAREVLAEALASESPADRAAAAQMCDALADQLDERAAARPETAADAMRRCPGCASEPVEGFVTGKVGTDARGVEVGTVVPCPDCATQRYEAWAAGTLHVRVKVKSGAGA